MKKMLQRLGAWLHRCAYEDSVWNDFGMGVEQRCRCGKVRHHFLQDLHAGPDGDIRWREGPHPRAEEMRRDRRQAKQPLLG
jgi:hypothetical protein